MVKLIEINRFEKHDNCAVTVSSNLRLNALGITSTDNRFFDEYGIDFLENTRLDYVIEETRETTQRWQGGINAAGSKKERTVKFRKEH